MQVGVDRTQMQRLPSGSYDELRRRGSVTEHKCTVCQEEFAAEETVTQLPCQHCFHGTCIAEWLDASKMCPVCMVEVSLPEGGGADAAAPADAVAAALATK